MEQVENKSLKIADLEEKINKLDGISREKDKEMEILKSKINDAEQKIKDIKVRIQTNIIAFFVHCCKVLNNNNISYYFTTSWRFPTYLLYSSPKNIMVKLGRQHSIDGKLFYYN